MEDRRLLILSRRGNRGLWWDDGGREGDRDEGVPAGGDARLPVLCGESMLMLSLDGDLPDSASRVSLMKSLTTVRDERLRGRAVGSLVFSNSSLYEWSSMRPLDQRR